MFNRPRFFFAPLLLLGAFLLCASVPSTWFIKSYLPDMATVSQTGTRQSLTASPSVSPAPSNTATPSPVTPSPSNTSTVTPTSTPTLDLLSVEEIREEFNPDIEEFNNAIATMETQLDEINDSFWETLLKDLASNAILEWLTHSERKIQRTLFNITGVGLSLTRVWISLRQLKKEKEEKRGGTGRLFLDIAIFAYIGFIVFALFFANRAVTPPDLSSDTGKIDAQLSGLNTSVAQIDNKVDDLISSPPWSQSDRVTESIQFQEIDPTSIAELQASIDTITTEMSQADSNLENIQSEIEQARGEIEDASEKSAKLWLQCISGIVLLGILIFLISKTETIRRWLNNS